MDEAALEAVSTGKKVDGLEKMPSRFVPYEMQTTLVKVTSYEYKNLCGYLSNPFFGGSVYFNGLIPMLQLMEDMLDSLRFPQRSMERRTFDTEAPRVQPVTVEEADRERTVATFKLRVLFRQNASWEGDLVWVDRQAAAQFRSVLELIGILDSALGGLYEQNG